MNKTLEAFADRMDYLLTTDPATELNDGWRDDVLMEVWKLFSESEKSTCEMMDLLAFHLFGESHNDITKALNMTSESLRKIKEVI